MINIKLPITDEDIEMLKVGDEVFLHGKILVGRDQVHKRFLELIKKGQDLPVSLEGEIIYYMGPSPTPKKGVIGACGPTTASRMDGFAPQLLEIGLKGMIGKGPRHDDVQKSIIRNKGIYFYSFGGCGALYSQCVIKNKLLAFGDLGPEALYELEVLNFPVIVAIDSRGNNIYKS